MEYIFNLLSRISQDLIGFTISSIIFGLIVYCTVLVIFKYKKNILATTRYSILWSILIVTISFPVIVGLLSQIDFSKFNTPKNQVVTASSNEIEQISSTLVRNEIVREENITEQKIEREPVMVSSISEEDHQTTTSLTNLIIYVPMLLSFVWFSISSILLFRLLKSYRKIKFIKKSALDYDISQYKRVKDLLRNNRLNRRIEIKSSDKVNIPIAAGFINPTVIIPNEMTDKLSKDEMEMVLIHEIAHLIRRDDWSNLFQQIVGSLNFFHPVVHWVNRQINLTREIACDESVMRFVGNPKIYAECLTKTLQLTIGKGTTLMSNAYTGDKQIFQRLKEILLWNKKSNSSYKSIKLVISAIVITASAIVFIKVTPAVAFPSQYLTYEELNKSINEIMGGENKQQSQKFESKIVTDNISSTDVDNSKKTNSETISNTQISSVDDHNKVPQERSIDKSLNTVDVIPVVQAMGRIRELSLISSEDEEYNNDVSIRDSKASIKTINDGLITYTWTDGDNHISITQKGKIEFSDNVRGVKSISKGGFFEISVWKNGKNSSIKVRPDENGELKYYFYSDKNPDGSTGYNNSWNEKEWPEQKWPEKDWFENVLLESTYKIGLGAEERADWLYKNGGVDKVFEDMDNIESDYTLAIYYKYLIKKADLNETQYNKILRGTSINIYSDYEKAEILIAVAPAVKENNKLMDNYLRAVSSIDSDYETRRTLTPFTFDDTTDPLILKSTLEIAKKISSDYEKSELLIDIAHPVMKNRELLQGYLEAVMTIESDYETHKTLKALSFNNSTDISVVETVLQISQNINSDYERSQLLLEISPLCVTEQSRDLLFEAIEGIESDYETSKVLQIFISSDNLDKKSVLRIIRVAESIGSDYEKSGILKLLIRCCRGDDELEQSLLTAIRSISSEYERNDLLIKFYEGK